MRVRAKDKVFVDNVFHGEGDEFEYNGPENPHIEPLDKEAAAAWAKSAKESQDVPDYAKQHYTIAGAPGASRAGETYRPLVQKPKPDDEDEEKDDKPKPGSAQTFAKHK